MDNLSRYNCIDILQEKKHINKCVSDRTDSDATSGIGLEITPNSNSSISSDSDKYSGTFNADQMQQSVESGYETSRLARCCSIYDNFNYDESDVFEALPEEETLPPDEESDIENLENDILGMGYLLRGIDCCRLYQCEPNKRTNELNNENARRSSTSI